MTDTHEDRKSALYGTLITFLLLNNLAVITRIYTHYRTYYRKGGWIFLEDIFLLLSGVSNGAVLNPDAPSAHLLPASCQRCNRQSSGLYDHFSSCVGKIVLTLTLATYYGLGLHAERLVAEDGAQAPHNMAIVFKVGWIRRSICGWNLSDTIGHVACLGHHGPLQSNPYRHQTLPPFLLSPPLPSQPEVVAHRLVG